MKIAFGVEYNGAGFHGWQIQHGVRTVQEVVEAALARVADEPIRVHCAGRTDAGVHAVGQVVHLETMARRAPKSWIFGANSSLPNDVSISFAQEVEDGFHARYAAYRRAYRYLVYNAPARPGVAGKRVAWEHRPLDPQRMRAAAAHLLGEHDFSAFRGAGCQSKSPVREVFSLEVSQRGPVMVLDVEANAFLLHMVRNIVGVLLEIGRGWREPEWAGEVLAGRDRCAGGATAPPGGLYLRRIWYPERYGIPEPREAGLFF
jgi:tRNA pseudouridine38-40 synthase